MHAKRWDKDAVKMYGVNCLQGIFLQHLNFYNFPVFRFGKLKEQQAPQHSFLSIVHFVFSSSVVFAPSSVLWKHRTSLLCTTHSSEIQRGPCIYLVMAQLMLQLLAVLWCCLLCWCFFFLLAGCSNCYKTFWWRRQNDDWNWLFFFVSCSLSFC